MHLQDLWSFGLACWPPTAPSRKPRTEGFFSFTSFGFVWFSDFGIYQIPNHNVVVAPGVAFVFLVSVARVKVVGCCPGLYAVLLFDGFDN